jgi:hypothetical protein
VSIVLYSIKIGYYYVSETGSVPVLRCIKIREGERLKDKKAKME